MFNNFFSENRAIYEIMYKNFVQPGKQQMTTHYGARALHTEWLQTYTYTALLFERSRDGFPVVSLGIFFVATEETVYPGVDSDSRNKYQGFILR